MNDLTDSSVDNVADDSRNIAFSELLNIKCELKK